MKKAAILTLLTLFFLIDDVLIFLLLKNVFDWQFQPLLYTLGAIVIVGLNFSLAMLAYKIMRKRPTTGRQGMIGKTGVVLQSQAGDCKVKVQGEIWSASSEDKLKSGDKIVVEEVEGLILVVRKIGEGIKNYELRIENRK